MKALRRAAISDRVVREGDLGDLRFRALLSAEDWHSLPAAVRRRFSKRLSGGGTVVYEGETTDMTFSRIGWCIAQAARLIGGPLPYIRDIGTPCVVTVTEDIAARGQFWTRLYARRRGFPQVVHSSKRFAGPTGLEEYVGAGIGMALTIHAEDGALKFRSAGYFLQVGRWRLRLPRWMTPIDLTVTHADRGGGAFLFRLDIQHPRFGTLLSQSAIYRDPPGANF